MTGNEFSELGVRTRVVFGPGAIARLGEVCRGHGRRVLVVTDPGIAATGHAERALATLRAAGLEAALFDGAEENPTTVTVERAVDAAQAFGPEVLVGLGGGSSLDTAKGANFLLAGGGSMRDYWGTGKGRGRFLPMIAVPTTGGTGSEMQSYALISDAETRVKMACGDPRAACVAAILDPELTLTQPPQVTAATGMDAITHAIETAVCRVRNPFSSMFSREAFRLLSRAFPVVLTEPANLAARADMQLGAALAGLAIEHSMLGAAHAMANPVTARRGVVHGQAVGAALPHVIRFNSAAVDGLYAGLLQAAGWNDLESGPGAASRRLAAMVSDWLKAAGMAGDLAGCGVTEAELPEMAAEAARQWTAGFNPRPIGESGFLELYQQAWSGAPVGATAA